MKNFDKKKFVKLALGYVAMLIITGTFAAIAFVVGDKIDQDRIKKDAENKVAEPAQKVVAAPWGRHMPLSAEQTRALALSAVADESIDIKCHRVGGNLQAKSCLETLRTELLQESARVWRNVLGDEHRLTHNDWHSNPLVGNGIEKDDWERLCLTGVEKEYGTREEPGTYLRTPSWCLSTAEIAAKKYDVEYDTRHAGFLHRKVSAISRWELR